MELSQSVQQGLALAGSSAFTDKAAGVMANYATRAALGSEDLSAWEGKLQELVEPATAKEASAAMLTFFVEAARTDTDRDGCVSALEECKVSSDRAKAFAELFVDNKVEIRAALARVSSTVPHIVNTKWRLDYYLKNKHVERINKPVFLIELSTEGGDRGGAQVVQFAATQEQLQDLVTKLKDATKSMDKMSQW